MSSEESSVSKILFQTRLADLSEADLTLDICTFASCLGGLQLLWLVLTQGLQEQK
jgi:hypothetical protein